MSLFYATFGQRYAREPHPFFPVHPDGYMVVDGLDVDIDEATARAAVFAACGTAWAFLYAAEDMCRGLFPRGALWTLVVHADGSLSLLPCSECYTLSTRVEVAS